MVRSCSWKVSSKSFASRIREIGQKRDGALSSSFSADALVECADGNKSLNSYIVGSELSLENAKMEWYEAIDQVVPHVFRISTPDASGSGWLVSRSQINDLCVLATAAHVIDSAHFWEKPIRITHHQSGGTLLLRSDHRAVVIESDKDTAAIVFNSRGLEVPKNHPPLFRRDHHLRPGNEIGWLGYPAVQGADLCFFEGHISAYLDAESSYLVDGVAINGVSGGPAFWRAGDAIEMIGLVSAYIPNRATGIVLPGVALIRDINQYHDYADRVRSLDEAQAQQSTPTEPPPTIDGETQARG